MRNMSMALTATLLDQTVFFTDYYPIAYSCKRSAGLANMVAKYKQMKVKGC